MNYTLNQEGDKKKRQSRGERENNRELNDSPKRQPSIRSFAISPQRIWGEGEKATCEMKSSQMRNRARMKREREKETEKSK